jgi:hypothetical protein
MGMTPPDEPSREREASRQLSDAALGLWVLAVLLGQFLLTCWWFGQMFSS